MGHVPCTHDGTDMPTCTPDLRHAHRLPQEVREACRHGGGLHGACLNAHGTWTGAGNEHEQVVVEGATMSWGGLLFRDPMLSWMNVVKYTTRNKFLDFGGLNSKIDDSMARKPIGLLLDYFFVTYTTLTIARDPRR